MQSLRNLQTSPQHENNNAFTHLQSNMTQRLAQIEEKLQEKANKNSVATALHRKANKPELEALLARKVDFEDLQKVLENKLDITSFQNLVRTVDFKADRHEV